MGDIFQEALPKMLAEAPLVVLLVLVLYKIWRRSDELLEKRYDEQVVAFREVGSSLAADAEAHRRYEDALKETVAVVARLNESISDANHDITAVKNLIHQLKDEVVKAQAKIDSTNIFLEQCKMLCVTRLNAEGRRPYPSTDI